MGCTEIDQQSHYIVAANNYNEEGVRVFLAERLASYKLPRLIIVLEAMPLTAIGKIDKNLLASKEALA